MDTTFRALCYMHAWDSNLPLQNGLAHAVDLRDHRLDYSVQSLSRIDDFLDHIRTTTHPVRDHFLADAQNQNLLYLIAFYIGEVIGRSLGHQPQWLDYSESIEAGRGFEIMGPCFENSIVLTFPRLSGKEQSSFLPLVAVTARLFEGPDEKSVLFSAGFFLPPTAVEGPSAALPQPLPAPPAGAAETAALMHGAAHEWPIAAPVWAAGDDLSGLFERATDLLTSGRVVWGALIQANDELFDPLGEGQGAPGEVIYDPDGRVPWSTLHEVAKQVFAFKGRADVGAELAPIANYLQDERIRVFGLDLPPVFFDYPLKISTTWFERMHLPAQHLAQPVMPIVLHDQLPGLVLPVPSAFWPADALALWAPAIEAKGLPVYQAPADLAHLRPFSLIEEGALYLRENQFLKAKDAFVRATNGGNPGGYFWLGKMHEEGLGMEVNLAMAQELYNLAADQGDDLAVESAERVRQLRMKQAKGGKPGGLLRRLFGG